MGWFSPHPDTFDACPRAQPALLSCPTSSEVKATQIGRTSEDRAGQVADENNSQNMWAGLRVQASAAAEII